MSLPNVGVHGELILADLVVGLADIIQHKPMTAKRYMELFSHEFTFCEGMSEKVLWRRFQAENVFMESVYEQTKYLITAYIEDLFEKFAEKTNEELVKGYTKEWHGFKLTAKVVNGVLSFMNRTWIAIAIDNENREIYFIYEMATKQWKMAMTSSLVNKIVEASLNLLQRGGGDASAEISLVGQVIESFGLDELGIPCPEIRNWIAPGSPDFEPEPDDGVVPLVALNRKRLGSPLPRN